MLIDIGVSYDKDFALLGVVDDALSDKGLTDKTSYYVLTFNFKHDSGWNLFAALFQDGVRRWLYH